MKVLFNSINPYHKNNESKIIKPACVPANESCLTDSASSLKALANYNLSTISFKSRNKEFQADNEYRKELAKHANCSAQDLKSVVGSNELKKVLRDKLTQENFMPGEDDINIKKGIFKANLHNHTIYSDGEMTVQELLDRACNYASRIKSNVYVALTDHNTLKGSQEAIKIIGQNPEKYENIKFVPGVELLAKYRWPDHNPDEPPANLEMLAYCINPFDEKINDFLEKNKKDKHTKTALEEIFEVLNSVPGIYSLAHPGRVTLPKNREMESFMEGFKNNGGNAIEAYYSYSESTEKSDENYSRIAKDYAEKMGMLKTGGRDSHRHTIFHRD